MRIAIYIWITLLSIGCLQAQGWEKTYTRNNAVLQTYASAPTIDGGSLLAGYALENGDHTGLLLKVDANGNRQQEYLHSHPSGDDVLFYDIEGTPDGGFIAGGTRYNPNDSLLYYYLVKYNPSFAPQWTFSQYATEVNNNEGVGLQNIEITPDSGFICTGHNDTANTVFKVSAQGTLEWHQAYFDNSRGGRAELEILPNQRGYAVFLTRSSTAGIYWPVLMRLNSQGDTLWTRSYRDNMNFLTQYQDAEHSGLAYTDRGELYVSASNKVSNGGNAWLAKVDTSDGTVLWETFLDSFGVTRAGYALEPTLDKGLIVTCRTNNANTPLGVIKLDSAGTVDWARSYGEFGMNPVYDIQVRPDTSYILTGSVNFLDTVFVGGRVFIRQSIKAYALKINARGDCYSTILSGKVYFDQDSSCTFNGNDVLLDRRLLAAYKDTSVIFYTMTNDTGHYEFRLDTGVYNVVLVRNNQDLLYGSHSCIPDTPTVALPLVGSNSTLDFPEVAETYCSLIEVHMGTPFLRRCFPGQYTVSYRNRGTAPAINTPIEVVLDPYLIVDTLLLPTPHTILPNNRFIFTIDTIDVAEANYFVIPFQVDCDSVLLGQTHCSQVSVEPDTNCAIPMWSGANIQLSATCLGDSIHVVLQNTGGSMTMPSRYFVYEDNIMLRDQPFQLGAGQSQDFHFEAIGNTYRIEAQQPAGFPPVLGDAVVARVIERCNGANSLGLVTSLPGYDGAPFIDIDCRQNIGAFDPNDKRGFPAGVGTQHYITKNDRLDYHIRFQNTGTDTAFTVIIIDTLDTALDASTLQLGSSSHAYTVQVYGYNPSVVVFTFDNILLVDSNTNEPLSHGFIQFSIEQNPNNPIGTVINNEAAIYFDFNAPIFTNTTWHTIGENFISIQLVTVDQIATPTMTVSIMPNPFRDQARLQVEGHTSNHPLQLQVFNIMGQQVLQAQDQQGTFELQRGHLDAGIYVFRIIEQGQVTATGKFIVR